MKKQLILGGILAGLAAGATSLAYAWLYHHHVWARPVNFWGTASPGGILLASLLGGGLASLGYGCCVRFIGQHAERLFNVGSVLFSVLSIQAVFSAQLPAGTLMPELFAGLTAPMHLFPILFWLTLKPFFIKN